MAGIVRGQAAFTWVDTDVAVTERVLLLAEPIRETRPAFRHAIYVAESLDFQARQVFTIGAGIDELVCKVRFLPDQQGLIDLLKAGAKGRTLVYHPDLTDPQQTHSYTLISPLSPHLLNLDPDTGVIFGYVEVELVLRSTS